MILQILWPLKRLDIDMRNPWSSKRGKGWTNVICVFLAVDRCCHESALLHHANSFKKVHGSMLSGTGIESDRDGTRRNVDNAVLNLLQGGPENAARISSLCQDT